MYINAFKAMVKTKAPSLANFLYRVLHFPQRVASRGIRFLRQFYHPELQAVVKSGAVVTIDVVGDVSECGEKCSKSMIKPWGSWLLANFDGVVSPYKFINETPSNRFGRNELKDYAMLAVPLALLAVPQQFDAYLAAIGAKSRNMLRKVERNGYTFRQFDYNGRLQEIYEINTSKEERGGHEMTQGYKEYPRPMSDRPEWYCLRHQIVWYGCFNADDKLVAYCCMHFVNDLGIVNMILGHGAYLSDGIMNGLIASMVKDCIENRPVKYLNYLTLLSGTPALIGFKKRVGFKSYAVLVNARKLESTVGVPFSANHPNGVVNFMRQWWPAHLLH